MTQNHITMGIFSEIEKIIQDQYNRATINEHDEELDVVAYYLANVARDVAKLKERYEVTNE